MTALCIDHLDAVIAERCDEDPMRARIRRKMINTALYSRQGNGRDKFQGVYRRHARRHHRYDDTDQKVPNDAHLTAVAPVRYS